MVHVRRVGSVLVCAVLLLAGCMKPPATRYYLLEPPAGAPAATGAGLAVGVLPFDVDAPYDQDRIVYRIGAESPQVGFYEYHRWAAPLSRALPRIAAEAFRGVAGVGRIEPVTPGRAYDVTLAGRLVRLEEVDSAAGQHVRIDLVLTLAGSDGSTLWSVAASGRSETSVDTVEGLVAQAGELAARVMADQREGFAGALGSL